MAATMDVEVAATTSTAAGAASSSSSRVVEFANEEATAVPPSSPFPSSSTTGTAVTAMAAVDSAGSNSTTTSRNDRSLLVGTPPPPSSPPPANQYYNGTGAQNGFDDHPNGNPNGNPNHNFNYKNDLMLDEEDYDDNDDFSSPSKATTATTHKPHNKPNAKGPATVSKRLILFLLVVFFLSLYKVTSVGVLYSAGTNTRAVVSGSIQSKNHSDVNGGGEHSSHRTTALVLRTMAPIPYPVLERIHNLALELNRSNYPYDFWILVDETRDNATTIPRLHNFFAKSGNRAQPPQVFSVSEAQLFEHYPKLISYTYNAPELNYNNESGVCCGRPIMWQMFVPTFGLFLHQTRYEFAWTFEDDIGVHGALSLLELIRVWDVQLGGAEGTNKTATTNSTTDGVDVVDLAAIDLKKYFWGKPRHTWPMEDIVRAMQNASVEWRLFSDAIQRHSLSMADAIVQEVSNNVMQFGERLIHPIAWKHNMTIIDLAQLAIDHSVYGALNMTGAGKLTSGQGVEALLHLPESPATFLFHEQLPGNRWRRRRGLREQQWRLFLPNV